MYYETQQKKFTIKAHVTTYFGQFLSTTFKIFRFGYTGVIPENFMPKYR